MQNVLVIQSLYIMPEALKKLSVRDIERAVDLHQNGEYTAVTDTVFESQFSSDNGVMYHLVTDFNSEQSYIGCLNGSYQNDQTRNDVNWREPKPNTEKKISDETTCIFMAFQQNEILLVQGTIVNVEILLFLACQFMQFLLELVHTCEVCGSLYLSEVPDISEEEPLQICGDCKSRGDYLLQLVQLLLD